LGAVVDADLPVHTAGLCEFAEGLMHLATQRDGFAGPDVASVEAKWGYADANFYWRGGYVVRLRDGRRAYIEGTSVPEFSEDGETYELEWTFDVRFLGDEPYHRRTPRDQVDEGASSIAALVGASHRSASRRLHGSRRGNSADRKAAARRASGPRRGS
jgi:hypothetical protein